MKLSNKEQEILQILWDSNTALNAKQICESKSGMVKSTVAATIRKLLEKKIIEVDSIVYSGTVLSRTYKPTISREEFISRKYKNLSMLRFVNFLVDNNQTDELEDVYQFLKEQKNNWLKK